MTYYVVEIAWVAGSLVYGVSAALIIGLLAIVPSNKADRMRYYAAISPLVDKAFWFSVAVLGVPIVVTWIHCIDGCGSVWWYILALMLTILACILTVGLREVKKKVLESRAVKLV